MTGSTRKTIRFLVLLGTGLVFGFWLSAGAHTGWSMDRVPVEMTDEITGLVYTEYEERYVPGIEVLGGAFAVGALLFAVTFLPLKKSNSAQKTS